MEGVEDAGQEIDKVCEGPKVQEAQAPGGPEEAAEAPDAEEGHAVVPPLGPRADLLVDQEEHDQARGDQQRQQADVDQVVRQQGLGAALHPAHYVRVGEVFSGHHLPHTVDVPDGQKDGDRQSGKTKASQVPDVHLG